MKNISILGATGSIGTQTLDVIRNSEDEIKLIGITANSSVEKMKDIIREFKPKYVGMMDESSANDIKEFCKKEYPNIEVLKGMDGLVKIATLDEIDTVAVTARQEKEDKFIATVACKAAVKGKMKLDVREVDALMRELLSLPNPFSCPHGRPTAIKMTKIDMEKKFSRR